MDDFIQKQVNLMYDMVTQTLNTIDEKEMVVSTLSYRTSYPIIFEHHKFTHSFKIKKYHKISKYCMLNITIFIG